MLVNSNWNVLSDPVVDGVQEDFASLVSNVEDNEQSMFVTAYLIEHVGVPQLSLQVFVTVKIGFGVPEQVVVNGSLALTSQIENNL